MGSPPVIRLLQQSSVYGIFVNTASISVLDPADPIFSFKVVVHAYWLEFKPGSEAMLALGLFKGRTICNPSLALGPYED